MRKFPTGVFLLLATLGCFSSEESGVFVEVFSPVPAEIAWYLPELEDTVLDSLAVRHPEFVPPVFLSFDHRTSRPEEVIYARKKVKMAPPPGDEAVLVVCGEGVGWRYLMPTDEEVEVELLPEHDVGGVLAEDAEWGEYGHYLVRDDIVVPEGITLQVKRGTWVRFSDGCGLCVRGSLHVLGEPDAPVVFTWEGSEGWKGLKFEGGSSGDLRWVRIAGAVQGVYVEDKATVYFERVLVDRTEVGIGVSDAKLELSDSWLRGCGTGVLVEAGGEALLRRTAVVRCREYGLWAKLGASIRASDSALLYDGVGSRAEGGGSLDLVHCEMRGGRRGVEVQGASLNLLSCSIQVRDMAVYLRRAILKGFSGNNIYGARWLVYLSHTGDVVASDNWWGSAERENIARRMRDRDDVPQGSERDWTGVVRFEPFAEEPFPDAGIR